MAVAIYYQRHLAIVTNYEKKGEELYHRQRKEPKPVADKYKNKNKNS